MRINKFFTEHGVCSRREADRLVEAGRVTINGQIAKPGDQVAEGDKVALDGKSIAARKKREVILAYHKPTGVICTTDTTVTDNIVHAVGYPERIFNIGRLDRFSEGLILLTNVGNIVNKILRARYGHEKEYIVELNGFISDEDVARLANGVFILGSLTRPCTVERLGKRRVRMILTEGRNRQIRRMIESVGLRVTRLKRVRILNISLDELALGKWRELDAEETAELYRHLEKSDAIDAAIAASRPGGKDSFEGAIDEWED